MSNNLNCGQVAVLEMNVTIVPLGPTRVSCSTPYPLKTVPIGKDISSKNVHVAMFVFCLFRTRGFPFGSFLDGFNCCVLLYNDKYTTYGVFLNAKVLSVCQLDK